MRISFALNAVTPCDYYRLIMPALEIHRQGKHEVVFNRIKSREVQVLVIARISVRQDTGEFPYEILDLDKVKKIRESGIKVVYDVDDDLWNMHPGNPLVKKLTGQKLHTMLEFMAEVDCVTCSTTRLAERLRPHARRIEVLQNCIDPKNWPQDVTFISRPGAIRTRKGAPQELAGKDTIAGLLSGSASHIPDFQSIKNVLESPALGIFGRPKWFLIGEECLSKSFPIDHEWSPVVDFTRAADNTKPEASPPSLERLQGLKFPFFTMLTLGRFERIYHFALAPLCDHPFNDSKSHLKYLEYSMAGIPCIFQARGEFLDSVISGRTGVVASTNEEWVSGINRLIQDTGGRVKMAQEAREHVMDSWNIETKISNWISVYESL